MNSSSRTYARYWSKSLRDSWLARGALKREDVRPWDILKKQTLQEGYVGDGLVQKYFSNIAPSQETVHVALHPVVFQRGQINSTFPETELFKLPYLLSPLMTIARLDRQGLLYPLKNFYARDLLEPATKNTYTIGTQKQLHLFLRDHKYLGQFDFLSTKQLKAKTKSESGWAVYTQETQHWLKQVYADWIKSNKCYHRLEYGYIHLLNVAGCVFEGAEALYQYIEQDEAITLPLFDTYTKDHFRTPLTSLTPHANFSKRLAFPKSNISLSPSQRAALAHSLELSDGEILAVNAPPGTGNKLFLKSLVLTQWAQAALEKKDTPPLTIAISSNAQTFNDMYMLFGKHLMPHRNSFEGRWLMEFENPPASYFNLPPAQQAQVYEKKFAEIETPEYLEKARQDYLIAAQINYPQLNITSIKVMVDFLQERIQEEVERLQHIENTWNDFSNIEDKISQALKDSPKAISDTQSLVQKLQDEFSALRDLAFVWEQYQKDQFNILTPFIGLISSQTDKLTQAITFLNAHAPQTVTFAQCKTLKAINQHLELLLSQKESELRKNQTVLNNLQNLLNEEKIQSINWTEALVDIISNSNIRKINDIADADAATDQTIRYTIYQLVAHYWEGQWLLATQAYLDQKGSGYTAHENDVSFIEKWKRRMMLVPCLSLTCAALPVFFRMPQQQAAKKQYAFNSIDLLIVNDAGETPPENAGASFALAKKALVIGDSVQSYPTPLISRLSDIANLQQYGLIAENQAEHDFLRLSNQGKTASLGSVMKIAQAASKYQTESSMPAGLFLSEQFSSHKEILSYYNSLSYQDKLKSMREPLVDNEVYVKKNTLLPALAYVHVDGKSTMTEEASYVNLTEAHSIASWLRQNQAALESFYRKPLSQIIAIITPYSAQARAIAKVCYEKGLHNPLHDAKEQLAIGNQHILQGSKRPIIIFSNTLSKHMSYAPANRDTQLFTAAASRATDTFLLFADMEIMEKSLPSSARGLLTQKLLQSLAHKLSFPPRPRADLTVKSSAIHVHPLQTASEHEAFFADVLTHKGHHITIACPALELASLHGTEALKNLRTAIERGGSVEIFTDMLPPMEEAQTEEATIARPYHKSRRFQRVEGLLRSINIPVHVVPKINIELLICDHDIYCVGNYHWLNHLYTLSPSNASLVYSGKGIAEEIEIQKRTLRDKIIST